MTAVLTLPRTPEEEDEDINSLVLGELASVLGQPPPGGGLELSNPPPPTGSITLPSIDNLLTGSLNLGAAPPSGNYTTSSTGGAGDGGRDGSGSNPVNRPPPGPRPDGNTQPGGPAGQTIDNAGRPVVTTPIYDLGIPGLDNTGRPPAPSTGAVDLGAFELTTHNDPNPSGSPDINSDTSGIDVLSYVMDQMLRNGPRDVSGEQAALAANAQSLFGRQLADMMASLGAGMGNTGAIQTGAADLQRGLTQDLTLNQAQLAREAHQDWMSQLMGAGQAATQADRLRILKELFGGDAPGANEGTPPGVRSGGGSRGGARNMLADMFGGMTDMGGDFMEFIGLGGVGEQADRLAAQMTAGFPSWLVDTMDFNQDGTVQAGELATALLASGGSPTSPLSAVLALLNLYATDEDKEESSGWRAEDGPPPGVG
jgi:hypothetical protein